MKWFQHQSDSYSNLKHQELIESFGIEGYGMWWVCCELVAQQGEEYRIKNGKNWKKAIKHITKLDAERIEEILSFMAQINLIDKKWLNREVLAIPKMAEYSDDYTKKIQRVSGHNTDNVRQDKKRIDKNREEENIFTSAFTEFWKSYPRKELKKRASEIWRAKKFDSKLPDILAFIAAAKETDRWKKGYVKQPTAFLNGECWNDDLEAYNDTKRGGEFIDFTKK